MAAYMGYLEELSVTEAENLKRTITKLFRQTCIIQMKYDPVTLTPRDNPDYELCARHKGFICRCLAARWSMTRRSISSG